MAGGFTDQPHMSDAQAAAVSQPTSGGLLLSGGSSADTWGAWTELNPSIPADAAWLEISLDASSSLSTNVAYAIGIGAAGSEVTIVPNLIYSQAGLGVSTIVLPVAIPAGTRLAAQFMSDAANDSGKISVTTYNSTFGNPTNGQIESFGYAGTGAIHGTIVDPGPNANTSGSWVTVVPSVPTDWSGFIIGFDVAGYSPTSAESFVGPMLVDIGIGPAGAEQVIVPSVNAYRWCSNDGTTAVSEVKPSFSPYIPMHIAAGTRIAVRAQSSITDASSRVIGVSLYGAGGGAVIQPVIAISTIQTQVANSPFNVSGMLTGYTTIPSTLEYSNDGTTWNALPNGATVTLTSFSFVDPGAAANASAKVYMQDTAVPNSTVSSAAFVITAPSNATITAQPISPAPSVPSGQSSVSVNVPFTLSSYASAPPASNFTYTLDGGAATALPGGATVTQTAVTIPLTLSSGSHAVVLTDTVTTGNPSATSTFSVSGAGIVASTLPTSWYQGIPISGASVNLTGQTGYAVLYTNAADEGTRHPITGSYIPNLTPQTAASYTVRVYNALTGGSLLAESAAIDCTKQWGRIMLSSQEMVCDPTTNDATLGTVVGTISSIMPPGNVSYTVNNIWYDNQVGATTGSPRFSEGPQFSLQNGNQVVYTQSPTLTTGLVGQGIWGAIMITASVPGYSYSEVFYITWHLNTATSTGRTFVNSTTPQIILPANINQKLTVARLLAPYTSSNPGALPGESWMAHITNNPGGAFAVEGWRNPRVTLVGPPPPVGTYTLKVVITTPYYAGTAGMGLPNEVDIPVTILPPTPSGAITWTPPATHNAMNFGTSLGTPSAAGFSGSSLTWAVYGDYHFDRRMPFAIDANTGAVTTQTPISARPPGQPGPARQHVPWIAVTDGSTCSLQDFPITPSWYSGPQVYVGQGMSTAHGSTYGFETLAAFMDARYKETAYWSNTQAPLLKSVSGVYAGATVNIMPCPSGNPYYYAGDLSSLSMGKVVGPILFQGVIQNGQAPILKDYYGFDGLTSNASRGTKFVVCAGDVAFQDLIMTGRQSFSNSASWSCVRAMPLDGDMGSANPYFPWCGYSVDTSDADVSVNRCLIKDSTMGLLGNITGNYYITNSAVLACGGGNSKGSQHNVYIIADYLYADSSYFSQVQFGHNLKGRCFAGFVTNCQFLDGNNTDSNSGLQAPTGGDWTVQNCTFQKGGWTQYYSGNSGRYFDFAGEANCNPDWHSLTATGNTFVNDIGGYGGADAFGFDSVVANTGNVPIFTLQDNSYWNFTAGYQNHVGPTYGPWGTVLPESWLGSMAAETGAVTLASRPAVNFAMSNLPSTSKVPIDYYMAPFQSFPNSYLGSGATPSIANNTVFGASPWPQWIFTGNMMYLSAGASAGTNLIDENGTAIGCFVSPGVVWTYAMLWTPTSTTLTQFVNAFTGLAVGASFYCVPNASTIVGEQPLIQSGAKVTSLSLSGTNLTIGLSIPPVWPKSKNINVPLGFSMPTTGTWSITGGTGQPYISINSSTGALTKSGTAVPSNLIGTVLTLTVQCVTTLGTTLTNKTIMITVTA